MKKLKICTVLIFFLFAYVFSGVAQVWDEWSHDKDEVFEKAKEADKFVLLFAGLDICPVCQFTSSVFLNEQGPHISYINNDYVGLFSDFSNADSRADIMEYISEYWERRSNGETIPVPWLYVINPNKKGEIVKSSFGPQTEAFLLQLIKVDLITGRELKWYQDEKEVFKLAEDQGKNIFKLVGKGASPNCQEVMDLLEDNPVKELLEANYILWYKPFEPNPLELPYLPLTLPVMSIISPDNPDVVLTELKGVPEQESLEAMIKQYMPVSVGKMQDVNIFANGNMLYLRSNCPLTAIIYTVTGAVANQLTIDEGEYTLPLSKGIYIVKLSNGLTHKVVIQ